LVLLATVLAPGLLFLRALLLRTVRGPEDRTERRDARGIQIERFGIHDRNRDRNVRAPAVGPRVMGLLLVASRMRWMLRTAALVPAMLVAAPLLAVPVAISIVFT